MSAPPASSIGAGRFAALGRNVRAGSSPTTCRAGSTAAGDALAAALLPPPVGRRLPRPLPPSRGRRAGRSPGARLDEVLSGAAGHRHRRRRRQPAQASGPRRRRRPWPTTSTPRWPCCPTPHVAWVGGPAGDPRLEVAPIDVGAGPAASGLGATARPCSPAPPSRPACRRRSGCRPTATTSSTSAARSTTSPTPCSTAPTHLPDPRQPGLRGRRSTTSWPRSSTPPAAARWRCSRAGGHERGRRRRCARSLPVPRSSPRATCPSRRCCAPSAGTRRRCLFATVGLFQGVDVPGADARASSPSTGCRSPDPTTRCWRPGASAPAPAAFRVIDLPAGRHHAGPGGRAPHPHARPTAASWPCFDPRLAKAGYRWDVVRALPPMRRTRHRAEAEAFLREIRR